MLRRQVLRLPCNSLPPQPTLPPPFSLGGCGGVPLAAAVIVPFLLPLLYVVITAAVPVFLFVVFVVVLGCFDVFLTFVVVAVVVVNVCM